MSLHTFTIDEAQISIYPTDANGVPITNTPVWLGACAEQIRIRHELEEVEFRHSGTPHPKVHHLSESHEIEIDRLWEMKVPMTEPPDSVQLILNPESFQNGQDYRLRTNMSYVMTIIWRDHEDTRRWNHRTYYGVTDRSSEMSGGTAEGKRNQLSLRAEYYV